MIRHLSLLLLATALQPALTAERPNILFIYTDDQSTRTVSSYPESYDWVETPHIDRLAEEGVRFSHAYIGAWCMPSRATMLTGHHQHGIQSMRMEGTYPGSVYDPEACPFWPQVFRQHGYTTAQIGKWHTGIDTGFGRDWDYQIVWNRPGHPANAPNYYDRQLISKHGGPPTLVSGYTTDNYTKWAVEFIEEQGREARQPWYLWLCYGAVHGPFTPAPRHLHRYPNVEVRRPEGLYPPRPGKPAYVQQFQFWEAGSSGVAVERRMRDKPPVGMKDFPGRPLADWVRQYHQGVCAIDEGVGRLLAALEESGQDENTLVVFTSDQGFAWGQNGLKSKVAPYDSAIAAPMIVRPPAGAGIAGSVVDVPVSGVDLPPTFFAQAQIPLPWAMHGHDLTPLFQSSNPAWEHAAMLVHTAKQYGRNTDRVPPVGDPRLLHGPGVPWYVLLAQGKYKYIRTLIAGETEELYDLVADPQERFNLAGHPNHQDRLVSLRTQAVAELRRTGAGMVANLPPVLRQ